MAEERDNKPIDRVLMEFLEDPAGHPDRDRIRSLLSDDPQWRRAWQDMAAFRRLAQATRSETAEPLEFDEMKLPLYLDGALPEAEALAVRKILLSSFPARVALSQASSALNAGREDGISLPVSLKADALARLPVTQANHNKASANLVQTVRDIIERWRSAAWTWKAAWGAAALAGVILAFLLWPAQGGFDFPAASRTQQVQVEALAPTELGATAFAGRTPMSELWPARAGYMAALLRDWQELGVEENRDAQLAYWLKIDAELPAALVEEVANGLYPCDDVNEDVQALCHAGVTLYDLLRGEGSVSDSSVRLLKNTLSTHAERLPPDIREQIAGPAPLTRDGLNRLASELMW
ncbi:MAG: hypothetical protein C4523_06490 [Myxococcales bacterium]|nr:MAG: hypothetical protein C4523_06490 [Myxococcales bacterium]